MSNESEYSTLRVAMCQVYTEQWAVEDNLRRTLESLREAKRQGADLAITPECVLHAYGDAEPGTLQQRIDEIAEPLDGPNMRPLRDCARELGLDVIVGFVEKADDGKFIMPPRSFRAKAKFSTSIAKFTAVRLNRRSTTAFSHPATVFMLHRALTATAILESEPSSASTAK
jgi:predicted amidohydrolase